jgi:hypothetical protein
MNHLKSSILTAALALVSLTSANAQTILTEWNFNSVIPDSATTTGTTSPSVGAGTIILIGGTTATFAGGSTADTSTTTDNSRYSLSSFPSAGNGNKTAGIQFDVSTVGFTDISFAYQIRHSNTAANTHALLYTLDRLASTPVWTEAAQFTFTPAASGTGDTWYSRSVNLTSISGLNENANAAFRIVSAFDPVTGNYLASRSTSNYGTTGTMGFDLVQVSGIPEPSSATLLGLGFLSLIALRRLNRKS